MFVTLNNGACTSSERPQQASGHRSPLWSFEYPNKEMSQAIKESSDPGSSVVMYSSQCRSIKVMSPWPARDL